MNRFLYNIAIACLLTWGMTGCSAEDPYSPTNGTAGSAGVYTMRLRGSCSGFDTPTRITVEWADGDQVHLRFEDSAGQVDGTATYDADKNEWALSTQRRIVSDGGVCLALYFDNPTSATASTVTLSPASVVYADSTATYHIEENLMTVYAGMSPLTGRIRFKGTAGQKCEVWGVDYHQSYSFSTHTFTDKPLQIATTVGEEGYTDFYQVFFPAAHTLLCGHTAGSCFSATFGEEMLRAGASGYVTLPTADAPGYWTLVNKHNLEPITLPQIGALVTSSLKSRSVQATVQISSNGNGTLSACGVLCSLQPVPDFDNSILQVAASPSGGSFTVRVNGLEPVTQYYLRPYVTNEKGTVLGSPVKIVTLSKEEDEDTFFDKEGFGEDNAEDTGSSDDNAFDKEDFGEDNAEDTGSSDDNAFDKEDFGEDNAEDTGSSDDNTIDKEDFEEDENLDT